MIRAIVFLTFGGAAIIAQPATAQSSTAERAEAIRTYEAYSDCLSSKAALAGMSSGVDPAAVVNRVRPRCAAEWREFGTAMLRGAEQSPEQGRILSYYYKLADGVAGSGVVEIRTGSCGSHTTDPKLRC